MNIIGDAYVDIHARDKGFERQVRKMVRDIKPPEMKIVPKVLMTQANKTLREFHSRNAKKAVTLKADLNIEAAEKKLDKLSDRFDHKTIVFKTSVDGSAGKILNTIRDTASRQLKLQLNTDVAMKSVKSLREAIVEATKGHELATVTATAETAAAELALATAARDRSMTIHADNRQMRKSLQDMEQLIAASTTRSFRIFNGNSGGGNPFAKIFRDPEIAHAMEGFANAAAGVIPLRAIKTTLTSLAGGFEALTTSAALIGTALASGLGAGLAGLGSALVIVQDIAQIVGGLSALPAIIGTVVAASTSLSMAWQHMGAAMSTDLKKSEKAMAKLPPGARETARALREVNIAVNEATDKKYWDTLGDSIVTTAKAVKGPLTEGMGQVAVAMAQNTDSLSKSIRQFATSGDMKTTFDNMVAGLQDATGGTRSFSDAMLTLTKEGSKRMPHLGKWFTKMGEDFNAFIQKSEESGAILGWIDTSVQRLKELGTIVGSTATILGVVGQAASDAGIGGLTELADGFRNASEAVRTSEFKRGLVGIFQDAKIATENLGTGLGTLLKSVAKVSPAIGDMMISASEGAQAVFEHIGTMFTDTTMMSGFQKFFEGVREGLEALGPSFESLGNILGDLGEMGGVLFENMAPGLNILMGSVEGFIENMKAGFMAVNPVLNNFVQVFTTMISGPIKAAGTVLGGFLTGIASLPLPIIGAIASLALLTKGLASYRAAMALTAATGQATAFTSLVTGMGNARRSVATNSKAIGGSLKEVGLAVAGSMQYMGQKSANWTFSPDYANSINKSNDRVKSSFSGLKGAVGASLIGIRGLMAAAWPLLAITAAIGVFMHFQEVAQQSKDRVQSFADGWNSSMGSLDTETIDKIPESFKQIGTSVLSDWGWQKSLTQNMGDMGLTVGDVQKKLSGSKDDVNAYAKGWNDIDDAFRQVEMSSAGTGKSFDQIRSEALDMIPDETFTAIGKTRKELESVGDVSFKDTTNGMAQITQEAVDGIAKAKTLQETLTNIGDKIPSDVFAFAENGGDSTAYLRDTLASLDTQIGTIMDNYETLNSMTASLDQKTAAFRDNLTQFNLEGLTDTDGLEAYHKGLREMEDVFEPIRASAAKSNVEVGDLFKKGKDGHAIFDWAKPAASELKSALTSQSETISRVVTGAYDTAIKGGDTVREATDAAKKAGADLVGTFDGKNYTGGLGAKLQEEFGLSGKQVQTLIDTMGLVPKDIETAINVENADEATQKLIQVQVTAAAIAAKDYALVLSVMDEGARAKITDTLGLARDVSSEDLEWELKATAESANMTIDQLMIKLASSKDPKKLLLDVEAEGAKNKIAETLGLAEGFTDTQYTATLKATADEANMTVDQLVAKLKASENPAEVLLGLKTQGQGEADKALETATTFGREGDKTVTYTLNAKGERVIQDAKDTAGKAVPAVDVPMVPRGQENVEAARNQAKAAIPEVPVPLSVQGMSEVDREKQRAGTAVADVKVPLTATGVAEVEAQKAGLAKAGATAPVRMEATGVPEAKAKAQSVGEGIKPVDVKVTALTETAQAGLNKIKGMKFSDLKLMVTSNAADVASKAKGAIGGIKASKVDIKATSNVPAMATTAKSSLAGIKAPPVQIKAVNTDATGKIKAVIAGLLGIKPKSTTITAENGQAMGAITAFNSRVLMPKSTTITVTTINRSIDANANGGMYMNNVRTFASGGLNKVQKAIQRHKAIGGGENRVAQIAKGSQNYRVWGETETGGEAYLPLGKSKRARSLKILKQVMDHFGIAPGESFADGGFLGGTSAGNGVTSFASGGTTEATKKAATARKEAAKKAKDILNEMNKAIRDFIKQLSTGLDSVFNRNRGTEGQKALYSLRDQGKAFVSEFRKSRPKDAKRMEKFNTELLKQSRQTKVWNGKNSETVSRGIANDAQRRQRSKSVDFNSRYTVRDYEKAIEVSKTALAREKAELEKLTASRKSMYEGIAGGLFGGFNLGSLVKSTDGFGYRPPTTAKEISSYSRKMLNDMSKFKTNLSGLKGKGYNQAIIADISQMGLAEGLAVSNALLADTSQKNAINSDYTKMFGAKGEHNIDSLGESYVGGLSRSIGVYSADLMYKSGKDIQTGLVKGLTDDVKALEKAGQVLSDTLIKKFKKIMGIKSPSKVFEGLGKFLPQGLVKGVDSQKKLVDNSIGNMVDPNKANLNLTPSSYRNNNSVSQSGIIDNEQTSSAKVQVVINPSTSMSEEQIGKSAARELQFRLDSMTI